MNILQSSCEAIVIPTNAFGVNGKGLALQAKDAFPYEMGMYSDRCRAGHIRAGDVFTVEMNANNSISRFMRSSKIEVARKIICVATKHNWRDKSNYAIIEEIAWRLEREINEKMIESISVPRIGCGLGGLSWRHVRPILERRLQTTNARIKYYEH